jgi:hypothetical protein
VWLQSFIVIESCSVTIFTNISFNISNYEQKANYFEKHFSSRYKQQFRTLITMFIARMHKKKYWRDWGKSKEIGTWGRLSLISMTTVRDYKTCLSHSPNNLLSFLVCSFFQKVNEKIKPFQDMPWNNVVTTVSKLYQQNNEHRNSDCLFSLLVWECPELFTWIIPSSPSIYAQARCQVKEWHCICTCMYSKTYTIFISL